MNTQKGRCIICSSFRELTLHLHELGKFCELLNDQKTVYKVVRKKVVKCGVAKTASVAKWLRLASQLDTVEMNTFRYEVAHNYCEPVADELSSNAKHDSSLATQITRFIFISNALEEAYRLSSHLYEENLVNAFKKGGNIERQRSHSTQVNWLIDEVFTAADLPEFYFHKVDGLIELAINYKDIFNVSFDTALEKDVKSSRGFTVVRNLRNQIAHAIFPIIENPEYTWEFDDPKMKKLILTLLLRASRLAAMNIQLILSLTCNEFKKSDAYYYLSEDPESGDAFKEVFSIKYLLHLHIEQSFGLNESSQLAWREGVLES